MFERFRSQFRLVPDNPHRGDPWVKDPRVVAVDGWQELMSSAAGCSFENGLYRLHSAETGPAGQENVDSAFVEYVGRFVVFAFDWLGRQFAVDFDRVDDGEPLVMMLEPGTGEALEIPVSFLRFHDHELVEFGDEALATQFYAEWLDSNPEDVPLQTSECVGYKVPLFLGGSDTVDNLELTDLDVYWTVVGQMRNQTRRSSAGAPVSGISINE